MQIHQIKRYPTLQIPLYPIYRNLLPHIQNPTETDSWLRDGLIDPFIGVYTPTEIRLGFFSGHALIVWVSGLNFEGDVGGYDGGVVTE
jgi:hypothetical protein